MWTAQTHCPRGSGWMQAAPKLPSSPSACFGVGGRVSRSPTHLPRPVWAVRLCGPGVVGYSTHLLPQTSSWRGLLWRARESPTDSFLSPELQPTASWGTTWGLCRTASAPLASTLGIARPMAAWGECSDLLWVTLCSRTCVGPFPYLHGSLSSCVTSLSSPAWAGWVGTRSHPARIMAPLACSSPQPCTVQPEQACGGCGVLQEGPGAGP